MTNEIETTIIPRFCKGTVLVTSEKRKFLFFRRSFQQNKVGKVYRYSVSVFNKKKLSHALVVFEIG